MPTTGFYEWTKAADGGKQPHLKAPAGGKPFALAGIWERWPGKRIHGLVRDVSTAVSHIAGATG